MPSTYSNNLRIELPGTGEQQGLWGITTNNNLGTLIDNAIAGTVTLSAMTNADYALTYYNGSNDESRYMSVWVPNTLTLTAVRTIAAPSTATPTQKSYIITNNSVGPSFTGSITGTTLVVSAVSSGTIGVGMTVYGSGVATGTTITALGSGTGTVGTYTVSTSQTVSSVAMTGGFAIKIGVGTVTAGVATLTGNYLTIPNGVSRFVFTNGTNFYFADSGVETEINALIANYVPQTSATGAAQLPNGTTSQRPTIPAAGELRYNSTLGRFEGYGSSWGSLGGATGGGSDNIFYENGNTIYYNYTVTSNSNAMSAGPITLSANSTVSAAAVSAGGTGYALNDILTVSGGTYVSQTTLQVTGISGSTITAVTVLQAGSYSVLPTNPVSVTGGSGSSALFVLTAAPPVVTVPATSNWIIV